VGERFRNRFFPTLSINSAVIEKVNCENFTSLPFATSDGRSFFRHPSAGFSFTHRWMMMFVRPCSWEHTVSTLPSCPLVCRHRYDLENFLGVSIEKSSSSTAAIHFVVVLSLAGNLELLNFLFYLHFI